MRLGIFGGSFDPIHRGHLLLAHCCLEQAALDQVWLLPTAHQPLKPSGPQASNADRLAMLKLAVAAQGPLQIQTTELDRGGVSYSVETLELLHTQHPEAELFFLMGADALADLPAWHRPHDFCQLATPLVVHRAGTPAPNFDLLRPLVSEQRLAQIRAAQVDMPPTLVSSSGIRALVASDGPWQQYVPPSVADYIQQHQLYAALP
jgi:nicotinate-nucleotide adenylyltransferase